ncbi:MAG: hypothetical protein JOY58_04980 [Solirubrobacterales bacterium]|nr:hypothetical protein [Solirubrobacterales bacterium]
MRPAVFGEKIDVAEHLAQREECLRQRAFIPYPPRHLVCGSRTLRDYRVDLLRAPARENAGD